MADRESYQPKPPGDDEEESSEQKESVVNEAGVNVSDLLLERGRSGQSLLYEALTLPSLKSASVPEGHLTVDLDLTTVDDVATIEMVTQDIKSLLEDRTFSERFESVRIKIRKDQLRSRAVTNAYSAFPSKYELVAS